MKRIEFSVERTNTGYSAYTTDDKLTVAVVGETLPELKANMVEALNLHFEDSGKTFTEADLRVTVDLPQFFTFYKVINASGLAARLGMPQSLLAQYINGSKKPSPKQVNRILEGVRAVGRELLEMQFA
jgi:predicted RNase H-like HicB family nuclease